MKLLGTALLLIASMTAPSLQAQNAPATSAARLDLGPTLGRLEGELGGRHGEGERTRIRRGL